MNFQKTLEAPRRAIVSSLGHLNILLLWVFNGLISNCDTRCTCKLQLLFWILTGWFNDNLRKCICESFRFASVFESWRFHQIGVLQNYGWNLRKWDYKLLTGVLGENFYLITIARKLSKFWILWSNIDVVTKYDTKNLLIPKVLLRLSLSDTFDKTFGSTYHLTYVLSKT